MKYLSQYTEKGVSDALKKAGAFFAFSDKQFDEQKDPNRARNEYINAGMGMVCPKDTVKTLLEEIHQVGIVGRKQDIAENGLNAIIRRELNNHEAYYTGNTESTEQALVGYPITRDQIIGVFKNKNYEVV
jgi:hypothetical protein